MSDNERVENHTIQLLQEMRGEMAQRFDAADKRFDNLELRLGSVEQHIGLVDQRVGILEPEVLKVIDAVTAIAKTQEQHSALLMAQSEKLTEIQRA